MRLVLEQVRHFYARRCVLNVENLELKPGITAVVGSNGAGKTTLLNIVAGTISPTHGSVLFDGRDLSLGRGAVRSYRSVMAWLPQAAVAPHDLTPLDLASYAAWLKKTPANEMRERVSHSLELTGLSQVATVKIGSLSGGQQRRASLAAVLVSEPTVLIMDEPSVGLDPEQRSTLTAILRRFSDMLGATVVVSTHILEDVFETANHLVHIHGGQVVHEGPAPEFWTPRDGQASMTYLRERLFPNLHSGE